MTSTLIASGIGFLTAVVTAIIGSVIAHRRLRFELLSTFKVELAKKQIEACEAVWSILKSTTFAEGVDSVITDGRENPKVSVDAAYRLSRQITEVFYSPNGLYLSRDVREALFGLRHFIRDEFLGQGLEGDAQQLLVSKNKAKKFRSKATLLRIALRAEIGVEDLVVARELTVKPNEDET